MKDMETRITSATVFRDGARITRIGKTELTRGEQIVRVGGITEYALQDSFRVRGHGKAILRGIDVKKTTQTYEPQSDIKEDLMKLKNLEKEKRGIQDQVELQKARISHLTTMMAQFSSEFGKWFSVGETGMDHLTKMDKMNQDLVSDAKKNLRTLSTELERIDAEIAALRNNIQRIQGERRTQTFTEVYVTLDVKESTPLELEVIYQLSVASWYSTYDVDIGQGEASLKRIAMVYNNTMENWEDIDLIVSTASARPVEAVKPQPYYVDVYRPAPQGVAYASGGRYAEAAPAMAMDSEKLMEKEEAEPMPEMVEEYAEASESLSGITTYDVPGKVTIEANRDPQPITLTLDNFESKRLHYWNASAMTEVVAQDEITNGDLVILPGNVKVYADGDFIGETGISTIAPREKFRLGTRAAYDMKAEKKLKEKDTEKAGLTRGKQKRGYKYLLELKNFSKSEIEIRIVDRIPYSTSEKIIIQMSQPTLAYKTLELGIVTWETKLESGKELKIEYGFEVEWEKDLIVRPPLP
ncbi:MAG: hypothetical protein C4K48_08940 [Candidatus Thorarchaeota archaeon]|nr:MAG: hypothetical protein C4K48_08940 [Candidatus Thorarchaeota archaeon]